MKLIDAAIWLTVSVLNLWCNVTGGPRIRELTYVVETEGENDGRQILEGSGTGSGKT